MVSQRWYKQVKWVKLLSRVRLFATPWTVTYHASLSVGFSRQEYWSGLLFPSPGDLPNPGIEPGSPALQADTLPSEPPGKTISGFPSKGFPGGSMVKNLPAKARDAGDAASIQDCEDSLEEEMTPVFLLRKEEPGGLWSIASQRVGRYWVAEHVRT